MRNSPEWKMGDDAQRAYAKVAAADGWMVVPMYAAEGNVRETQAPMLLSGDARDPMAVSPDLLLMRSTRPSEWNDVKAKKVPTWRRAYPGPRWEHGCDRAVLEEYKRVQDETGVQFKIIVRELHSPIDGHRESPLTGPPCWLSITLGLAFAIGDIRDDWPGGRSQPTRRGRRGMGGILWARTAMTQIQGDGSPVIVYTRHDLSEFACRRCGLSEWYECSNDGTWMQACQTCNPAGRRLILEYEQNASARA